MEKTCPFMGGVDCQKQCALRAADGCALFSIGKQLFDIKHELDVMRTDTNKGNSKILSSINALKTEISCK